MSIRKYIYASLAFICLMCSCDPWLVPPVKITYEEDANGHKYVDLGLSVKWAAYDIGANSATELGDFFAWGETQPKKDYSWDTYKFAVPYKSPESGTRSFDNGYGQEYELTKYNLDPNSEYYDGKTTLELMDDAAHMAWGGNWRMPTNAECKELVEKCEWTWTEYLGVYGYDVKGPNGNRIFLPYMEGRDMLYQDGTWLYRWSSSVRTGENAYRLDGDGGDNVHYRCEGLFVRAVWGKTLPKFFILSFDANGGEGQMNAQTFEAGVSQAITANTFTRDGYTFAGWNTAADGSGTSYKNVKVITLTQNMTLYAQWFTPTYVDLGLSVKWATCNVGATSPEGYGSYFAWGETSPKDVYSWATYKYCNGLGASLTKYNTISDYGTVDNKTTLDLSDDAARVNWGGTWRMPTYAELDELRYNCTWTWTTQNGVNGYKVTSKTNGNSIFLPPSLLSDALGYYWSSSLDTPFHAYYLIFNPASAGWGADDRCSPRNIRAVFSENDTPSTFVTLYFDANGGEGTMAAHYFESGVSQAIPTNVFTRSGYYFVGWNASPDGSGTMYTDGQVIALSEDLILYAQWKSAGGTGGGGSTSGTENGHEWVDLGLPSGTKWAICNVGATSPEDYGEYFAWGETSPKNDYSWSTYKYCNGSKTTLTKYNTNSSNGTVDNKTTLDLSDDAARANWGGTWRMPTYAELVELRYNCIWTWTTQNGVRGYKVTSKTNGNSIFLPAAGLRDFTSVDYVGSFGHYWSSSLYESKSYFAYNLNFNSGNVDWDYNFRYYGRTVRAVCP